MTGISIPVAPMRADLAALVAGGAALALHASVPSTLDAPLLIGPVAIASCRSLAIFLVALTCPTLVLASRLYRKHRRDDAEPTSRDRTRVASRNTRVISYGASTTPRGAWTASYAPEVVSHETRAVPHVAPAISCDT